MLIVFFDCKGGVHEEFVPPGQIVNAAFYVTVLERLRKRVACIRPAITDSWKLHHDNAQSHDNALVVVDYLAKHRVPTIEISLWFQRFPSHPTAKMSLSQTSF